MQKLLQRIEQDYPTLNLEASKTFSWSPRTQTVSFKLSNEPKRQWSLLHEVAHALLNHKSYRTDLELLLLEVAAWNKAKELASTYGIEIDVDHIEDCIDTYRDWLYQRSKCPTCLSTSLQQNATTYQCFNCGTSWTVTASRFCRPYRLTTKQQKTPLEAPKSHQTTFL